MQAAREPSASSPAATTQGHSNRLLKWGKRALWLNLILAFLFIYLPILILVVFSFNDSKLAAQWEGLTFRWYASLVTSESILSATRNSLVVAIVSTIAGTISAR